MADLLIVTLKESKLNVLNKKIVEIKKKIQLSEGQRKANFEECDALKRENTQKILNMKREVKELYVKFVKAKNNEDAIERATRLSRKFSANINRRGTQEAIVRADGDNVRLRKKLDMIKYQSEKKQHKFTTLLNEFEELKSGNVEKMMIKKMEYPAKKKIITLEVQLERMKMMQLKADIVRRKYRSVRARLKEKSVSYASSLKMLEISIKEQEDEMKRLQGVKEEANELKDSTQETLVKQEMEVTNTEKQHDQIIQEYRKRVAERKMELERLERMIFSTRTRDDYEEIERNGMETVPEDVSNEEMTRLEEAFTKLRNATGVSRNEEVLNRFLGQRSTQERLQKMKMTIEQEKMILDAKRQEYTTEIEMQKFSETKNANENSDQTERLKEEIINQKERQKKFELENQRNQGLLDEIVQTLWRFCDLFRDFTAISIPEGSNRQLGALDLIQLLQIILKDGFDNIEKSEKSNESLDYLTDKFEAMSMTSSVDGRMTKIGIGHLFPKFSSSVIPAAPIPSEDEEEVPTRNTLKRQAQLLVDTKSRRKGFTFRR